VDNGLPLPVKSMASVAASDRRNQIVLMSLFVILRRAVKVNLPLSFAGRRESREFAGGVNE
jgi:hypothetical protein